mgnify:CR=1 FL=1
MNSLAPVIAQLELQTMLFNNATTGFSNAAAENRLGQANHVKWLTGHLVSSRHMMANMVGLGVKEPYPALFENGKGRRDDTAYPSMAELTKDWNTVTGMLIDKLGKLSETELDAKLPYPLPGSDGTLRGHFGFMAHHEAYTIGQISYARRIAGMEAMKYAPKEEAVTA